MVRNDGGQWEKTFGGHMAFGPNMYRVRLLAAAAVAALSFSQMAVAADLGGDCCADLEERIAELEATTVRKGNRKVKLEVSGHINEALLYWDDGVESNVGVYTNDNSRSRFRFRGSAKIDKDWSAGYLLEIGVRSDNSKRFTQDDDNAAANDVGLDLRHSVWFVESKTYGKLWVGLTGGAAEGITEINQANTRDVAKYSDVEDSGLGLFTLVDGRRSTLQWRRLLRDGGDQAGEGRRSNMVRYDTPEIMGFIGTANLGEDDGKEIGLRWKGELGDFKIAAGLAYGETTDGNNGQVPFQCAGNNTTNVTAPAVPDVARECSQIGGSISALHVPTGIYVNFASGQLKDDGIDLDPGVTAAGGPREDTHTMYAGEVGIEQKFNALGKSTFFVQYAHNEGGTIDRGTGIAGLGGDIQESTLESFGAGFIQAIDAADMLMYVTYRHYEGDITRRGAVLTKNELDDLDVVMSGALIRF